MQLSMGKYRGLGHARHYINGCCWLMYPLAVLSLPWQVRLAPARSVQSEQGLPACMPACARCKAGLRSQGRACTHAPAHLRSLPFLLCCSLGRLQLAALALLPALTPRRLLSRQPPLVVLAHRGLRLLLLVLQDKGTGKRAWSAAASDSYLGRS